MMTLALYEKACCLVSNWFWLYVIEFHREEEVDGLGFIVVSSHSLFYCTRYPSSIPIKKQKNNTSFPVTIGCYQRQRLRFHWHVQLLSQKNPLFTQQNIAAIRRKINSSMMLWLARNSAWFPLGKGHVVHFKKEFA